MKSLAWIVTALLVAGTGAFWLRSMPVGEDVTADSTAELGAPAPAAPSAPDGRRPAATEVEVQRPALAPHLALVSQLWGVLGTGNGADAKEEQRLLIELVADGSDGALAAAIEALEDPRCVHYGRGDQVLTLLGSVEGRTPVFQLARTQVEALASNQGGEYSIGQLNPWFHLAARHGEARGTRYVLEHLRSSDPTLRRAATDVAVTLSSPEQRELVLAAFLGDLGLDPEVVKALAFGLARESDDALRATLFELALDDLGEPVRRGLLLEYLGEYLDETNLYQYILLDRQLQSTDLGSPLQLAVTRGLARAKADERLLPDPTLDLVLGSFVLESIADPDPTIASQGANLARMVKDLHDVSGLEGALKARLEGGTSATLAGELNGALNIIGQ